MLILFSLLALGLGGIAFAAFTAGSYIVAVAAGALAAWMASLVVQSLLRRRRG
jgi:hypothetical protein